MHSRPSSRPSLLAKRAKSMSPASAQQQSLLGNINTEAKSPKNQALAAATRAFSRSNVLGHETKTTSERVGAANPRRTRATSHFRPLTRGKNARLSSVSQNQLRWGKRRASGLSYDRQVSFETTWEFAQDQGHSGVAGDYRPSTSATSDPQETFESNLPSLPSSYRRVRKSKSAYNPRSTGSRHSRHIYSQSPSRLQNACSLRALRDSKSTPVLRHYVSQASGFRAESQHEDAVLTLARERYLKDLESQRMKPRSVSFFSNLLRKHPELTHDEYGDSSIEDISGIDTIDNQFYNRSTNSRGVTRRTSGITSSIKSKFKRVFRRRRSSRFPSQQLLGDRPYFRDYMPTTSNFHDHYRNVPLPEEQTLSRMHSRESLLNERSKLYSQYESSSIRSAKTQDTFNNLRSRVTSWTSSSVGDNATLRLACDMQRLSVIDENGGPHQSPSLMDRETDGRGYSAFKYPMYNSKDGTRPRIPSTRRLYSALMKKMDDGSRPYKDDESYTMITKDSTRRSHDISCVPRRRASGFSQRTFQTVRHVPEAENVPPEMSAAFLRYRNEYDDNKELNKKFSENETAESSINIRRPSDSSPRKAQQGQSIREVRSSFYPHSSESKMKSPSPFKKAKAIQRSSRNGPGLVIPKRNGFGTHLEPISIHRSDSVAESMSLYSRTTGGRSIRPEENDGLGTFEAGTATIIQSTQSTPQPMKASSSLRIPSSKSSHEWQAWMSSEVAKLETLDADKIQLIADPAKHKGHRREHAQIEEYTDIKNPDESKIPSIGLLSLVSPSNNSLPKALVQRSPSVDVNRPPLLAPRSFSQTNISAKRQTSVQSGLTVELTPRKPSANENENPSLSLLKAKQSSPHDQTTKTAPLTPGSLGQMPKIPATGRDISPGSIEISPKLNSGSPKSQLKPSGRPRYSPNRNKRSPHIGMPSAGRLKQSMLEPFEPVEPGAQRANPLDKTAPIGSQAMVENFLRSRRINKEDGVSDESRAFV